MDFDVDLDRYPPIQGLDFYRWVELLAELSRARISPSEYDDWAMERGVAGSWTQIDKQWQSRMQTDWKLGALFGEEYEDTLRQLR